MYNFKILLLLIGIIFSVIFVVKTTSPNVSRNLNIVSPNISIKPQLYFLTKSNDKNLKVTFSDMNKLSLEKSNGSFFTTNRLPLRDRSTELVAMYSLNLSDGSYIEYQPMTESFQKSMNATENTLILTQIPLRKGFTSTIRPNFTGFITTANLRYFFKPTSENSFSSETYSYNNVLLEANTSTFQLLK